VILIYNLIQAEGLEKPGLKPSAKIPVSKCRTLIMLNHPERVYIFRGLKYWAASCCKTSSWPNPKTP